MPESPPTAAHAPIADALRPPAPNRPVRAAVALALVALFAYRISSNVADPDLYHQLALAREALRAGAIPRTDVFAFTPVHPVVVHHEWGAGFLAFLVAGSLGGGGIMALKFALAAAIAALSVRTARRGGDLPALALAAPVAILLVDHAFSPVRAQLYTLVGVAFTLACIESDRAGHRGWMAPHALALLVWANLHGGFVVGLVLLGAYAVEAALEHRRARHVVALVAIEALLSLVNPWGTAYAAFVIRALSMERSRIPEWAPLLSSGVPTPHLLAFGTAVVLVAYGLSRRAAGPRGLILLAVTAAMALRAHRLLPIFGLTWFATAPRLLAGRPLAEMGSSAARRAPWAVDAAAGALTLWCVALLVSGRPWRLEVPNAPASAAADGMAFPVGATRFLRAGGFRGRLMTTFETGAYVSWKLHPDVLVSLDGRYEAAYPERVFTEVMAFYEGRRAPEDVIRLYAPDAVLVPRGKPAVRATLSWPVVYDDGAFAVMLRPGVALAPVPGPISTEDQFP